MSNTQINNQIFSYIDNKTKTINLFTDAQLSIINNICNNINKEIDFNDLSIKQLKYIYYYYTHDKENNAMKTNKKGILVNSVISLKKNIIRNNKLEESMR